MLSLTEDEFKGLPVTASSCDFFSQRKKPFELLRKLRSRPLKLQSSKMYDPEAALKNSYSPGDIEQAETERDRQRARKGGERESKKRGRERQTGEKQ